MREAGAQRGRLGSWYEQGRGRERGRAVRGEEMIKTGEERGKRRAVGEKG